MSKEDLIPLKAGTNDPYSNKIRAMLKGSSSLRWVDAQRVRRLREAPPEKVEKMVSDLVANPESSKITIAKYIIEIMKKELPDELRIRLASVLTNFYRAMYPVQSVIAFQQNLIGGDGTASKIISKLFEGMKIREKKFGASEKIVGRLSGLKHNSFIKKFGGKIKWKLK